VPLVLFVTLCRVEQRDHVIVRNFRVLIVSQPLGCQLINLIQQIGRLSKPFHSPAKQKKIIFLCSWSHTHEMINFIA
jgi:hypothetical protein